jgi:hypothetical protein
MKPATSLRRAPRLHVALVAALVGCAFLTATARAAADGLDTSLKLIPADAAFYSAMLRNQEQVELVVKSQAWAKLWALPSVQQAWKSVEAEYKNPGGSLSAFRQFLQADENKELVAMLEDAASDEVFCYGDDSWVGFFSLYQEAYSAMQYQPALAQLEGTANGRSQQELQGRAILSVLAKNPERIKVPNFVLGFKVSDAQRAERQIKRLETLAQAAADQQPELKGRVKRTKVGDAAFLALTLDGSQIPWDQVPWKQIEDKPGEFAQLAAKLKALTLTVSLGVSQGYLMLGVGPSADHLARLGGTGPHLDQSAELKPLAKFADKKLTSIGYASKTFNQSAANSGYYQLDSAVEMAKAGLAKADLSDEERKALIRELNQFSRSAKSEQPDAGPNMSFTFLTDRGYEGYSYDYGKHRGADGSKPLTLLNHVGGAPLLAAVGRTKTSVEGYEQMVKGIQEAFPQLDKIAMEKLTGEDKQRYQKAKDDFLPLIKRLDETTDKLFLPALADGQFGFVLDAKWTSKQWLKAAPATETAMPAPEIGVLVGVSDADALVKAMTEYRAIANEALTKIKAWPGCEKIGDFQIPLPKTDKSLSGTLYSYLLPEEWGVDPKVVPTAGLTKDTAVLTLSHAHAERLLASHPLRIDGGPLADRDRPLAAAMYFNWPGVVDAAGPWVQFGTVKILEAQAGGEVPAKTRDAVLSQVRTVMDVLKCWRGESSATTLEDGVLVTHHESVYKDLEK